MKQKLNVSKLWLKITRYKPNKLTIFKINKTECKKGIKCTKLQGAIKMKCK